MIPVNPGEAIGRIVKLGALFLPERCFIRSFVSWIVLRKSSRLYFAA